MVVRDVVRRADGTVAEATDDWYADDDQGNVWYLGEDTATYDEQGRLEGSDLVRIGSISDPDGNGLTLIEARDGFDPHAAPAQP